LARLRAINHESTDSIQYSHSSKNIPRSSMRFLNPDAPASAACALLDCRYFEPARLPIVFKNASGELSALKGEATSGGLVRAVGLQGRPG
jgi:hypothetical protein